MQEPGFNSHYLADMKLWVTHSQFIVEHINAMTTLAREHTMLTPDLAQRYLQSCEIALQRCQQRLEYDAPGESGDSNILEAPETLTHGPMSTTGSIYSAFSGISTPCTPFRRWHGVSVRITGFG